MRLRDRFVDRRVARALTAPSGILLAGASAAAGVLAGLPLAAALGVGAAAWGARVALAVPRSGGGGRIDPSRLEDPWRRYVLEALDARRRFTDAVAGTAPGPLRDRLASVAERVGEALDAVWRTARRGQQLTEAARRLDRATIEADLDAARRGPPGPATEATVEALQAQLDTVERLEGLIARADAELRLLDARLDEAVARAIELSVGVSPGTAELAGLDREVDDIVTELESLRAALEAIG